MEFVQRKVTYRLYPNATQQQLMQEWLALHCRVYNTMLEERRIAYENDKRSVSFSDMCKWLTHWRSYAPALAALNAQSLQVTAKRLDLAFKSFFRRVKAKEEPGYPRFKSPSRYPGWGYKTYGDGWKVLAQRTGVKKKLGHGMLRLSGIGSIPMRGASRFIGSPKTAEIIHRRGKWYVSITYDVSVEAIARPAGAGAAAFDWGLETLLTLATPDGKTEAIDNPRWLKSCLTQIKGLQRNASREEQRIRLVHGLAADAKIPPVYRSKRLKRLYAEVANLHSKASRQRHDFYHKLTAMLVSRFGFLGTEELAVENMVKAPKAKPDPDKPGQFLANGKAQKAVLNRSIMDAAPSMLISMLKTKAAEAASELLIANTRALKPTQRCHQCGSIVKKTLKDRSHACACGSHMGRDENAAKTILRWMLEGDYWSGTGQGVLTLQETPSTARSA